LRVKELSLISESVSDTISTGGPPEVIPVEGPPEAVRFSSLARNGSATLTVVGRLGKFESISMEAVGNRKSTVSPTAGWRTSVNNLGRPEALTVNLW
jgi:hypothetical protein